MQPASPLDPRQTMARLPSLLQHPLTWITGKPLPGQRPLWRWTPTTRLISGLLTTAFGIAVGAFAASRGGAAWLLLPLGVLIASGGLRALYLEVAHNAVHHLFGKTRRTDRIVTEALTTLTLTPGYDVFRREHVIAHHGYTGTLGDPDYRTLLEWDFVPGTPLDVLRRRALLAPFSAKLHWTYLRARLAGSFADGPLYRRALVAVWVGGLLTATFTLGSPLVWLCAWWLPLVWGYQTSSALQMISGEHRWGREFASRHDALRDNTRGRFLGDPYPSRGAFAKARWWSRLVLLHLPARIAVFVGNDIGPAHDVHHRTPKFDWPNAAYARQALLDAGRLPGAEDVWGSLLELVDVAMLDLSGESVADVRSPRGRDTDVAQSSPEIATEVGGSSDVDSHFPVRRSDFKDSFEYELALDRYVRSLPCVSKIHCSFDGGWSGKCRNAGVGEPPRCEQHAKLICVSCNAPATRSCPDVSQFVCGAPLCNACEHVGGMGHHLPRERAEEFGRRTAAQEDERREYRTALEARYQDELARALRAFDDRQLTERLAWRS